MEDKDLKEQLDRIERKIDMLLVAHGIAENQAMTPAQIREMAHEQARLSIEKKNRLQTKRRS